MAFRNGSLLPSYLLLTAMALAGGTSRAAGQAPPPVDLHAAEASVPAALDSVLRAEMARDRIPGAALVILQDAEISFARGYGVADAASGRPVRPDVTRFPLGSFSKLVTATAVMRLVESGELSLQAPVERYLGTGLLPEGPGGPVTLHHLLTHTGGFEPANLGVAARQPDDVRGLAAYLSSHLPRRVRPPGELYVYSQHGYGLLGRVVEQVSGREFPAYVRDEIFGPLGMTTAALRRKDVEEGTVATGYYRGADGRRPAPAVYHRIPPAGGLVSTPVDVGRLLAAHLSGGGPVLGEATTRRMQRRQWSPHPDPAVEGTSYGLFEYRACGLRALTSRGWVGGHASYAHLVPDLGAGFLVTTNASDLGGLDQRLREALHVRLAGGDCGRGSDGTGRPSSDGDRPGEGSEAGDAATDVTGVYRSVGYGGTGVEALGRLLLSPVLTVRREGGSPVMDFGTETARLSRSDSLLYRTSWWEGRDQNFAYLDVMEGRPRFMMWGGQAYERIPRLLRPATLWAALGLAGLLFLSAVVLGGVRAVRRLATGGNATRPPADAVTARLALAASVLWLAFGVGMALELGGTARYQFAFGVPATARLLLWMPTVGAGLALALLASAARAWMRPARSPLRRLHWTAVAVAATLAAAAATALGLVPP